MGARGPEYDVATFPDVVELCGVCGSRVHRMQPDDALYCYRCGRAGEEPAVAYVRADAVPVMPPDVWNHLYWLVNGDTRRSFGERVRGVTAAAKALAKKYKILEVRR